MFSGHPLNPTSHNFEYSCKIYIIYLIYYFLFTLLFIFLLVPLQALLLKEQVGLIFFNIIIIKMVLFYLFIQYYAVLKEILFFNKEHFSSKYKQNFHLLSKHSLPEEQVRPYCWETFSKSF